MTSLIFIWLVQLSQLAACEDTLLWLQNAQCSSGNHMQWSLQRSALLIIAQLIGAGMSRAGHNRMANYVILAQCILTQEICVQFGSSMGSCAAEAQWFVRRQHAGPLIIIYIYDSHTSWQ